MINEIKYIVNDKGFQDTILNFLVDICKVDTTPSSDIQKMSDNENRVFSIIEEHIQALTLKGITLKRQIISPDIKEHKNFSPLHFTKNKQNTKGLSSEEVYSGRSNLLCFVDAPYSKNGINTAINAHIDVVAPYFPPRKEGDIIYGRGAIDDKGSVASIYGALLVLDKLVCNKKLTLKNKITTMFVVEEETGGNGSLSLAINKNLQSRYDSILIMECASNFVYPGNRGAVWFKTTTQINPEFQNNNNISVLESIVYSILEMQNEGAKLKSESNHKLFPHKPVQTCNGMLGNFGEHPSRICGYLAFTINSVFTKEAFKLIEKLVVIGNAKYINVFGDKTKVIDPKSGQKKVEKHYSISYNKSESNIFVEVFGSTGHMGSILENDAAITKWAYIAKEIIEYRVKKNLNITIDLLDTNTDNEIVLEGGQGFVPTHTINEVMDRMSTAHKRGIDKYTILLGLSQDVFSSEVTYDKLHNNAFETDADSTSYKNARKAAIDAGMMNNDSPVKGWDVSCDARLFASERPEIPILTSGPGELKYAHADNEQLFIPDLFQSIEFLSKFLILETGAVTA